jgi:cell division septum initiation protein DivIVA
MPSPRYQVAKLVADALNALARGVVQAASSIEYHIAEFHAKMETKAHLFAQYADQRAIEIAEDAHDKLIATHHSTMKEANAMYEAAQREAHRILAKAKADRKALVDTAADGCDEVRQALRKARDWHDA